MLAWAVVALAGALALLELLLVAAILLPLVGWAGVIVAIAVFPITLTVTPFYAGLALDDWLPLGVAVASAAAFMLAAAIYADDPEPPRGVPSGD